MEREIALRHREPRSDLSPIQGRLDRSVSACYNPAAPTTSP